MNQEFNETPLLDQESSLPVSEVKRVTESPNRQFHAPTESETSPDESLNQHSLYVAPGPGIFESLGWIGLFFVLQIVAMFVVLAGGMVATTGGEVGNVINMNVDDWLDSLDATTKLVIFTSPALLCYFILVPMGLLRLIPRPMSTLNLSLPSWGQVLVAASLVLPLTIVADATMKGLTPAWENLVETVPVFKQLDGSDVHELLGQLGDSPLLAAIFFIAVVPGLGEEFLFRGLIGRGLVARWGLIAGVLITSCLFAVVHMFPPHVIAIIPVGIALHWIYLTTKSFWAPVLFHFMNNAIATILMRAEQTDEQPHWVVVPIAATYFVWCLYWLYQMRTTYQTEEGPFRSPGHEVAAPAGIHSWRTSRTYVFPVIVALLMLVLETIIIASAFYPDLI